MAGVWLWLRRDWTVRWRSSLLLAVLVALTGGTVLALVAGARRTEASLDRFDRVALEGTFVDARGVDPAPLRALAGEPPVRALGEIALMAVFPQAEGFFPFFASVDGRAGRDLYRSLLLRGRRPDPTKAGEVALPEMTAARLGVDAGDRLRLASMTPGQWAAANDTGAFPENFLGPPIDLDVVGVIRTTIDVAQRRDDPNPALVTPAFFDSYRERIGVTTGFYLLRLQRGLDDLPRFTRLLEKAYGSGPQPTLDAGSGTEEPRNATRVVSTGLLVAAGTALVAGLFWLALAIHRHVGRATTDLPLLAAIGFGPGSRFALLVGTAVPAIAAGLVGAGVVAVLGSPLLPVGLARRADPDVGFHADLLVLAPGLVGLAVIGAGLTASSALRARSAVGTKRRATAPPVMGGLRRAAAGVGPVAAVTLALRPEQGDRRPPVRSSVAGAVAGLVGVLAVGIVGASIGRLLDTPARFGAGWDVAVSFDDRPPVSIESNPDIAGAAVGIFQRPVTVKGRSVFANALDPVKGDLPPTLADGRAPMAADEVALGRDTLEKADISVGSTIAIDSSERPPTDFRVVGQAVFPSPGSPGPGTTYEEPRSVADGALLTPAGLERLGIGGQNSNAGFRKLLIQWRPGVDHDAALAALGEDVRSPTVPRPGPEIARLAEVERFPQMVAGFLVAVSVVAVAHGLMATVRHRRHDLAVLGALGFTSAQRRKVVGCHAMLLAALAVLLGLPLGIATGRWIWIAMSRDLGIATDPRVPTALAGFTAVGTVAMFGLLAAWTGRSAARVRSAGVLRAE